MLAGKIRGLGLKPLKEKKPVRNTTTEPTKEKGKEMKFLSKNKVFYGGRLGVKEEDKGGSNVENAVWMDADDYVFGEALVTL